MTATAPPAEDRAALVRRRLVASQMRLMDHHPFFGSLLLLAPMEVTDAVATAATDGVRLFFNPSFTAPLTSAELDGLVVHELLHCALRHGARRGPRQPELWNIAADIHVNGQVRQMGHLSLPEGAAEDLDLAPLCVEEIYARLLRQRRTRQLGIRDLLEPGSCGSPPAGAAAGAGAGTGAAPSAAGGASIDLDAYWSDAMQRALAAAHMRGPGTVPAGLRRMIGEAHGPQLDWRTALWRHLVRTPDDFRGFDRRHAWQGIYLDALEGDTLVVDACVDTSGSVSGPQLAEFLAELRGILLAYPSVDCRLYYADAACHGPYEVSADRPLPRPKGGGGTDFIPFFRAIAHPAGGGVAGDRRPGAGAGSPRLAVYLTDGFGRFPPEPPTGIEVLWVVTPGGLETGRFPFGQVVRMVDRVPAAHPRVP